VFVAQVFRREFAGITADGRQHVGKVFLLQRSPPGTHDAIKLYFHF
jgi:hypothetical protein